MTVDETWVSTFDPETKQSSSMWKTPSSPSPQKVRVCRSHKKQMFIVFYDTEGVILFHGVPVGRTINSEYYQQVNGIVKFVEVYKTFCNYEIKYFKTIYLHFQVLSRHFLRAMRRKRPQTLATFLLHQDNAPCHKSASTKARMDELVFTQLDPRHIHMIWLQTTSICFQH